MAEQAQAVGHHARPHEGVLEMDLVDALHQIKIFCAFALGLVVERASADAEQVALAADAQLPARAINRRALLRYSPKALAFFCSHSSSMVSWPTLP